jgi:hypothetical protein
MAFQNYIVCFLILLSRKKNKTQTSSQTVFNENENDSKGISGKRYDGEVMKFLDEISLALQRNFVP